MHVISENTIILCYLKNMVKEGDMLIMVEFSTEKCFAHELTCKMHPLLLSLVSCMFRQVLVASGYLLAVRASLVERRALLNRRKS